MKILLITGKPNAELITSLARKMDVVVGYGNGFIHRVSNIDSIDNKAISYIHGDSLNVKLGNKNYIFDPKTGIQLSNNTATEKTSKKINQFLTFIFKNYNNDTICKKTIDSVTMSNFS